MSEKIAVIGLGYVGLPVALGFARHFDDVVGFDINNQRISELRDGFDRTQEVEREELSASSIRFTADPEEMRDCTFFVVTVPTPIDTNRQPDLSPLRAASKTVGRVLHPGAVVVYESTVYPGVTEEVCGPILAEVSGLKQSVDFKLGYSPERINPGDKEHTLERITKVVSGEDAETLERVANAYGVIVKAGVHKASSIKVAEAAKVIENTQRDLNIALMNELSIIFERMGIRTNDVLEAAGTKWNFLKFTPGLVGGHCIGVDPYYLTAKAEAMGYHPQVILSGRRINDGMGAFIAQKTVKMLIQGGRNVNGARVAVLGLTFKEDVPDLRNSRVPDVIEELRSFGVQPLVYDPVCDADEAEEEYGIHVCPPEELRELDAVILAVRHREFLEAGAAHWCERILNRGAFVDVKSAYDASQVPEDIQYWSL